MQITRKLLSKNDYVRNKDQQDPISVLKLSQSKLTEYIEKIGYVGHTAIPETILLIKKPSECILAPLVLLLTNSVFYNFCRLIRKLVKVNFTKRSYIIQFKKLMLLNETLLQDKFFILMIICF